VSVATGIGAKAVFHMLRAVAVAQEYLDADGAGKQIACFPDFVEVMLLFLLGGDGSLRYTRRGEIKRPRERAGACPRRHLINISRCADTARPKLCASRSRCSCCRSSLSRVTPRPVPCASSSCRWWPTSEEQGQYEALPKF